jgi:hypothetical protein
MSLNRDDFRWVIGMNRLRHAYLSLHPELEANFITSPYDDVWAPCGRLVSMRGRLAAGVDAPRVPDAAWNAR